MAQITTDKPPEDVKSRMEAFQNSQERLIHRPGGLGTRGPMYSVYIPRNNEEQSEKKQKNRINSWVEGHSRSVFLMSVMGAIFFGGGAYIGSIISMIVGAILNLPAVLGIILILKEECKNEKKEGGGESE